MSIVKKLEEYIEELKAENAALRQEIEKLHMRVAENVGRALQFYNKVEQLKTDNAALLECVQGFSWWSESARECLAKIGGNGNA